MRRELRLLNIEDSEDDSLLLLRHLTKLGYDVIFERVDTPEAMKAALDRRAWDVIVSDYVMPRFSAMTALEILRGRGLDLPFIIVSGAIGEETAVAAMRGGAHDYIMKDSLARLVPAIERELHEAANRRERRRAEDALRSAERLSTLGRLAATIAHEINNPLEAVTNVMYLLRHHASLDNQAQEYVSIADQELARVTEIVRQALSFSRGANLGPTALVPARLIENVLDLHATKIERSAVDVRTRFEYTGEIQAVEGELRQVLSNLIVNAIDAIGESGGTLVVQVAPGFNWRLKKRGVRILIGDTGPGIRPEHRKDIFEPFFSTKGHKGTGLGLWIARQIIEKHGGSIRLRSSVREGASGTVFAIFLPAEAQFESRKRAVSAIA